MMPSANLDDDSHTATTATPELRQRSSSAHVYFWTRSDSCYHDPGGIKRRPLSWPCEGDLEPDTRKHVCNSSLPWNPVAFYVASVWGLALT